LAAARGDNCPQGEVVLPNSNDERQIEALGQRILAACADSLGGIDALARHLDVPAGMVKDWIDGKAVPPATMILKAVDPLIDQHRKQ
jgi:hypothetical protein